MSCWLIIDGKKTCFSVVMKMLYREEEKNHFEMMNLSQFIRFFLFVCFFRFDIFVSVKLEHIHMTMLCRKCIQINLITKFMYDYRMCACSSFFLKKHSRFALINSV